MADVPNDTSGVRELIGRLRDDGVKAGREEAERRVQEGRQEAEKIIASSRAEAAALEKAARERIEAERKAAQDAIRMAYRDTRLKLAGEVRAAFSVHLRRLVSAELRDPEFLRRMLLALFGRALEGLDAAQPIEVLVPADLFVDRKLVQPTAAAKDQFNKLLRGVTGDMLRDGITVNPSGALKGGFRVQLAGQDLEIDLSDETVANLMLEYLLPRYRDLVREKD